MLRSRRIKITNKIIKTGNFRLYMFKKGIGLKQPTWTLVPSTDNLNSLKTGYTYFISAGTTIRDLKDIRKYITLNDFTTVCSDCYSYIVRDKLGVVCRRI